MPGVEAHEIAPRLLNSENAAKYLCIGKRKLWELGNRGCITQVRSGRIVRYALEDLDSWIEDSKRKGPGVS